MRLPGFTLVEVLVVLVILALALSALPRAIGPGQAGRLRAAADEVTAVLREARMAARATGRATQVVFETATGTVRPARGAPRLLPAGIGMAVEGPAQDADAEGRVTLRFDAEGGSPGGRVRLMLGSAAAVVELDWVTGLAR